ncbi:isoflavone reductase family protein [Salix suchowensis]|nr:isoflavone reductase family protein [Salix suchowensis]
MSNGEKVPLHKEIGEDISKLVHKLGMEHMKHPMGEKSISIVTLAGENRGATMNMGFESTRKDGSIHIHRGYKINPDESSEATTDGEGSSKGRSSKDPLTKEPARKACINSNTQSVNNSMLFETSVSERNPGVQLNLSYIDEEPSKNSSKPVHLETRKAEFQVTPAEKLSYEPTVKRRCLRGLFMESSDSDLDNPEKPRRHGCRYDCGKKS